MKTTQRFIRLAAVGTAGLLSAGCVGYNTTLFATKTNVGLDFDTKPPTAEIAIARREAVIAPTFEDGKTPPVAASFRIQSGAWVFADISSTFAGGDAANILAQLYNDPTNVAPKGYDSTLWLTQPPTKKLGGTKVKLHRPGVVRPLLFGTDTTFGLKLAWSGLTAQVPDTMKLGFNRKEMALAPVFGGPGWLLETNGGAVVTNTYFVKMPSFLATMDGSTKVRAAKESKVKHVQYFATGTAADNLAVQPDVRTVMTERLDPAAGAEKVQRAIDEGRTNAAIATRKIAALSGDELLKAGQHAHGVGLLTPNQLRAFEQARDDAERRRMLRLAMTGDNPEKRAKVTRFLILLSN
jgi:hypothetical protein